jgi:hypothetical protein
VSETAVNKSLNDLSATEVIDLLGLEYLDGEGVWIKLLWLFGFQRGVTVASSDQLGLPA